VLEPTYSPARHKAAFSEELPGATKLNRPGFTGGYLV